jgi:nucleoside-diphosphate-sugar epimerase
MHPDRRRRWEAAAVKIVVIGGTGHIGGYLVPMLVEDGHEVTVVTRGTSTPYRNDPAWDRVQQVIIDRTREEQAGTFADRIADLGGDVVVDMICFTEASAQALVDALRGRARQLIHIGTIWIHGRLTEVPVTESAVRHPWGEYGTRKDAIERLLLQQSRDGGVPTAVVHPGHISGPGWPVINPQGTAALDVWRDLAVGTEVLLPGLGLDTVHHVHAEDVAQLVRLCIEQAEQADHEAFHAVSAQALTLRGFAEAVAGWFGREAALRFVPYEEFWAALPEPESDTAREHITRSHVVSIDKARSRLGYQPRYSSLQAVAEAVEWLRAHDRLGAGLPPIDLSRVN